jgi:lysophospholipase L1-like esterase
MDSLPPNAGAGKMRARQLLGAALSNRTADYFAAAVIAGLALAVSPVAIRMLTGRAELTFRLLLLSVTFDVFLLLVAGAVLTQGRARRLFFAAIACTLPLVLLAALETLAGVIHLSDRVAMFQDVSTLERGSDWGPGKNHLAAEKDGFVLYLPWSGRGVTINALGLRTAPPAPKAQGEHRIAVVGSSETFGFRLADADTIPALLQAALQAQGHSEISVYNFGIEDATIARELALLKHFKDIYDIDQVVFVAGASDLYSEYFAIQDDSLDSSRIGRRIAGFELYRTIERIRSTWFEPSRDRLAQFDARFATYRSRKGGGLVDGIVAADNYCTAAALRCDFVLQPLVLFRQVPSGTEPKIARTYLRQYPHLDLLASRLYREAIGLRTIAQIHDLTAAFDDAPSQFFIDEVHLNEAGNRALVKTLLPIVTGKSPAG